MISALILGFLFVALVLKRDRHWLLAVLVGACALQGLVISLGQSYGVGVIRAVQPVSAMFVPPLAWIAFQVTAVRPLRTAREALHLGGPMLGVLCVLYLPSALDPLIPLAFVAYGGAMLLALRAGICQPDFATEPAMTRSELCARVADFMTAGSKSRHFDRVLSVPAPTSNPTTTTPILPQLCQSTGCSTYPLRRRVIPRRALLQSGRPERFRSPPIGDRLGIGIAERVRPVIGLNRNR